MMDSAELELFTQSIRQATERHTGGALDAALVELGWQDALAISPRIAVSSLFPLQGAANATSSALSYVLAAGLGVDEHLAAPVVLPALGTWLAPGRVAVDRLEVRGWDRRAPATTTRRSSRPASTTRGPRRRYRSAFPSCPYGRSTGWIPTTGWPR